MKKDTCTETHYGVVQKYIREIYFMFNQCHLIEHEIYFVYLFGTCNYVRVNEYTLYAYQRA